MKENTAKERIDRLCRLIAGHDHLYYNLGAPELTDSEYDRLYRELKELEEAHPGLARPDSPTRRVGAPLPKGTGFATAAHLEPMLSIESLFAEEEVREFANRVNRLLELEEGEENRWVAEPKYDGVSANLLYEKGLLIRGLTRGDGSRGEEVTANLRTIRSIPLRLHGEPQGWPDRIEVRGEVILSRQGFLRLQEEVATTTATPFRNARNAVAGSLKRLDPALVAGRGLDFIAWGVGALEGAGFDTYGELIAAVGAWGFKISPHIRLCDTVDRVLEYHREMEERRESLDYEMDGIVAKVDRLDRQAALGRTSRTPRWVMACKFAPRRAETRVRQITVQVGRVGTLTPVAELEPVELAGVTVQRATLHNEDILRDKDVRPGDLVVVERAGDVIPAVVEVVLDRRPAGTEAFAMPAECPVCSSAVEREGAMSFCTNIACPAQIRARILHLVQRRALDIDRLGPKYVDQLMEAGILTGPAGVFGLAGRREEILALPRWGERSFENLIDQVDRARTPTLARFIFALGIRGVGETTARDLATHFGSLAALREADEEALQEVDGVGPEVSRALIGFFALQANRDFLAELAAAGVTPQETAPPEGALAGTVWCFTGRIEAFPRDRARALVEEQGGRTATGISKKVTHLVAGPGAGAKLDKATKLGIRTLEEEEFLALLRERGLEL